MGAMTTNRLKPRQERAKLNVPRRCGFCGETGHRANGNCKDRKEEYGFVVPAKEIDRLVNELTCRSSPDFNPNVNIPVGSHIFEQVHPDTNFICIHNYTRQQTADGGLSQENSCKGQVILM